MKSSYLLPFVIGLLCAKAHSQTFESERSSPPVRWGERQLQTPWNGGYNTLGVGLTDIDGDGDADLLLTGRDESRLVLYRNDGSGAMGRFTLADDNLLQFDPNDNRLAFEDFDDDGDADLFVGANDGRLRYFRNDGNASDPEYSLVTDFFDDIDVGFVSAAAFGDLNDDGRRDLVVGSFREGLFYYTRNAGASPAFSFVDTLRDAGGELLRPGFQFYVPALVDIDADGDLDLFAGSSDDGLAFFRNEGTSESPMFALVDEAYLDPPGIEGFLTPAFVDIDGDLDFDLFMGNNNGLVTLYRNDGSANEAQFNLVEAQLGLDYLDFGFYASPVIADLNSDGDLDLFVATDDGKFHFLENTGTDDEPAFEWITDNFAGIGEAQRFHPEWGDLDADGDLDLLFGMSTGGILMFENTGTTENASFGAPVALRNASDQIIPERRPALGDLDADNDLDLVVSQYRPADDRFVLLVYRNEGTAEAFSFSSEPDSVRDNAGGVISDYDSFHRLVDLDSDSDLDLVVGNADGFVVYYENVGSPEEPSFSSETVNLDGIQTGSNNRNIPVFADIDADGDPDAFVGRFQGGLFFYRNQSEPTGTQEDQPGNLTFEVDQNYPNPFQDQTSIVIRLSKPSVVSIRVFDILGREAKRMDLGTMSPGQQNIELDTESLPPGVYVYRLEAGRERIERLMVKSH